MSHVARGVFVVVMALPPAVQAGIYVCKDASGRTLTADRPIPECADRPMREYANTGTLRREIAAPPTPEQRRQLEEERRKKQAEEDALIEQRRADRALLARYRNEEEIVLARKREIDPANELLTQLKAALRVAEKDRTTTQAAVDAPGQKPTLVMLDARDRAKTRAQEIGKDVRDAEASLQTIGLKYDTILARYREIAAAPPR